MPHIGIKRLGAGHREDDRTQQHEAINGVADNQLDPIERVQRLEDAGILRDLRQPEKPKYREPEDQHRAEEAAHAPRAAPLRHEQDDQQHQRERYHIGLQLRRSHLQTFDRAQDGDRRGQHAIAKEQGAADQPGDEDPAVSPAFGRDQCLDRQGEDAALAAIIGTHQQDHVFPGNDDRQRPDDQRQHAKDARLGDGRPIMKALLDGIEGRGADIAEHDPEGRNGQIVSGAGAWRAVARRRRCSFC